MFSYKFLLILALCGYSVCITQAVTFPDSDRVSKKIDEPVPQIQK